MDTCTYAGGEGAGSGVGEGGEGAGLKSGGEAETEARKGPGWVRVIKKVLTEESASLAHVAHMWQVGVCVVSVWVWVWAWVWA